MSTSYDCPLCSSQTYPYWEDKRRQYYGCEQCGMVHVPSEFRLSEKEEKAIYDLHDNQIDDQGYRRFLSRVFDPLNKLLSANSSGLDFGCGPGPALAAMLEEAGHSVSLYDIFYYPDSAVLNRQYQFITATEVVEHLSQPKQELERLWRCLEPGGLLGIMTKKVQDKEAFSRWHYKNDLTHICFFAERSFEYLSEQWGADIVHTGKDVIIFKKQVS